MNIPLVVLAHNIRSMWNVGSFFRSADAFHVQKVYLTGYTACPPRKEIAKTALGAEGWIAWECERDPLKVIERLKRGKYRIVALEKTKDSIALEQVSCDQPTCLIVGNEILGVSEGLLKASDVVAHIPMSGRKESLNVAVALGIALYHFRTGIQEYKD